MTDAIESRIHAQRATLENALDAIEDRLNVSKKVSRYTETAKASYSRNPLPWIVGAAVVAVSAVGLVAWALLSDD
jgi:hypothetical protein